MQSIGVGGRRHKSHIVGIPAAGAAAAAATRKYGSTASSASICDERRGRWTKQRHGEHA